jgi:Cu(I)/Ag(I) efflux system membrane protein CusA/SilA
VLGLVWPESRPMTTAELIDSLDKKTRVPGWTNGWTAPVRARIDMMATGVRTPVGIRVVAGTPERLNALGSAVQAAAARVPGTRSAVYEGLGGETRARFELDRDALARHGVDPRDGARRRGPGAGRRRHGRAGPAGGRPGPRRRARCACGCHSPRPGS